MPSSTQPATLPIRPTSPSSQMQTISLARSCSRLCPVTSAPLSSSSPSRPQSHSRAPRFAVVLFLQVLIFLGLVWLTSPLHRRRYRCRVQCAVRDSLWRLCREIGSAWLRMSCFSSFRFRIHPFLFFSFPCCISCSTNSQRMREGELLT